MSTKIICLLLPLMLLALMPAPAGAVMPGDSGFENPLILGPQMIAGAGGLLTADISADPFVLAKGPGGPGGGPGSPGAGGGGDTGGPGGFGGGPGSPGAGSPGIGQGGNSNGDCCDNGPQGGQDPAEDEAPPYRHRHQYHHRYGYGEPSQTSTYDGPYGPFGPGDGTGNDGEGPRDGDGYGAPENR